MGGTRYELIVLMNQFIFLKKRLRTMITRWILPVFLTMVGVGAINLVWLIPAIQNIRASASVLSLEVADRLRSNMEFGLENSLNQLNGIADEIAVEPDRTQTILEWFLKNNPNFQNVAIADRTGKERVHIDRVEGSTTSNLQDHSRDPFFYVALQNISNFWNIQISKDQKPYTTLAVPIRIAGNINFVIIADLHIADLVQTSAITKFSGQSYVVDRNGFVVLSSDSAQLARHENLEARRIIQKVVVDGRESDGLSPGDSYVNDEGVSMFVVGLPIRITGWGIFVEQPASSAFGAERIVIAFAVITWLLGIGIVFAIIRGNYRLGGLNERLNDLLKENYEVGKILVRRDIELTEANSRLMALDASKSEFVSVAAHQLRTPITGIRWSFNALLDRELGDINGDQEKILEDGLKASVRMIDLINDLLNVARIEEGRFGLHFKKQPFGPIIQAAFDRQRKMVEEKGILCFLDIQPGLPSLDVDEEKISIALDNVLDNAIKYTSPGGTVTIKVKEEKNAVQVTVADTGIGIPQNQIEKLFVKFFRADNALRFQTSGSGLGLYVVKNIVETHGGIVSVTSEEHKGTTVSLSIPFPSR